MSAENYVHGIHAVEELIQNQSQDIKHIHFQKPAKGQRLKSLLTHAEKHKLTIVFSTRAELDHLVPGNHQGVIAHIQSMRKWSEKDLDDILQQKSGSGLFLILDGVQDPHNLGACLRSAECVGVDCVIIPKDRAVGMTSTVRKVACGAAQRVPLITVTNLARTMQLLKEQGVWLYGLAGEANYSLYETSFSGAVGLVLGAEEKGLRRLTREHCDQLISIPMVGTISSLNVSVATGISLYEIFRQKQ